MNITPGLVNRIFNVNNHGKTLKMIKMDNEHIFNNMFINGKNKIPKFP